MAPDMMLLLALELLELASGAAVAGAAPVLLASVVLLALRRPSACLTAAACLALVAVPLPDTVDDAASVERAAANVDLSDGCVLRAGAAWCNSSMLVVSRARCRHRMRARTAIVVWRNMAVTTTTVPRVLVLSSGYIWKGRPRAMGARFALVSRAQSTKEKSVRRGTNTSQALFALLLSRLEL